ncbi:iron uptake porin [Spirulina sp. CCNP1310]|uniref:iron uptake porin n=1 Tax=Spirulina sp. CCNP1310 TaxID=3110249 RepID=UPI002B211180|nr:iron uptake porin [Spirulina sp. CCNP1310]MEA5417774.1 iron uptake porin [Spirulina sp. CCNP1310]
MSKKVIKALFIAPAALGAAVLATGEAQAQYFSDSTSASDLLQQIESYSAEGNTTMGQFTGASQFSDVSPSDWAFQALDDLVRRYDCLKGYPNGTYRGNRSLSRYEFAAGLNACLQQIERLIAETTADFATKEDLETMNRLMQEFEAELAMLGTRVDNLESRVSFLEDNQFSTTTKLAGEAVWTLGTPWGKTANVPTNENLTFDYRARLRFDTSFTGEDLLVTRLNAGNGTNFGTGNLGTGAGVLNYYGNTASSVNLDKLWYQFPLNDSVRLHVAAQGIAIDDILDAASTAPYSYDDVPLGNAYNTAFYDTQGAARAAVGANIRFNDNLGIDLGYFAGQAEDPTRGIFGGSFALPVQLNASFGKLNAALGYSRTFSPGGSGPSLNSVGTNLARTPFGPLATSGNHYHLALSYDLSPKINVSGFAGYTVGIAESGGLSGTTFISRGSKANIWNWALNVSFPEIFQDSDVLRLGFGQVPSAARIQGPAAENPTTALLGNIEYRFNVNDNIELAPAFFMSWNPNGTAGNNLYGAALRTIFRF